MKQGNSKSIRAVVKNLSDREELDFQRIVTRYLHERLLYRISLSEYNTTFILKGGNLMYAIEGLHTRPTIDIDMLAKNIDSDKETVKRIFAKICAITDENDCVIFNPDTIAVSDIAEEKKYSGIRLLIDAQFDTIRQTVQVDIGFGDVVTPAPVEIEFPVLLKELGTPLLLAYSTETVIAEKFHAIITLGNANSRMKDLFDTYILLKNRNINNENLTNAIVATFKTRNTEFEAEPVFFDESYYKNANRNVMWKAFLRKTKIEGVFDFEEVVKTITTNLQPIYQQLNK